MKVFRAEYDRLIEQSPSIDEAIISRFKKVFKSVDIRKPEVCNGLHRCKVYELSEDEKMANVLAIASQKIIKPIKKWEVKQTPSTNPRHESMKELSALNSMSVVSQFKEKIAKKPINEVKDEIKDEVNDEIKDEVKDEKKSNITLEIKEDDKKETDELLDDIK